MSSLDSDALLIEGIDLISDTTVEGALYGFSFALYIFCAHSLYRQLKDEDRRRQHIFTLIYMSLMMALTLFGLAVDARDMQLSYINNANYPTGGNGYEIEIFSQSLLAIVGYSGSFVLEFMTSGIAIWRLWIVWRATRYSFLIVILPVLLLLADLGMEIVNIWLLVGINEWDTNFIIVFLAMRVVVQLCLGITVTFPIIARIYVVRRNHLKIMGQTDSINSYTSIISMLIESFALDSAWMVGQVATLPFTTTAGVAAGDFLFSTRPFIQLIAYLLVVCRVTTGRGWKEDTAEKLTTLQWQRDEPETAQNSTRASIPITHGDD